MFIIGKDAIHSHQEKKQNKNKNPNRWIESKNLGTNMDQKDYLQLIHSGEQFSEEEAKFWIHNEYGFDPDLIELVHEVSTYEFNMKTNERRIKKTYERGFYFYDMDWNYVRFNCCNWQWEIVNGMIYSYES